jgi:hypothetical protein
MRVYILFRAWAPVRKGEIKAMPAIVETTCKSCGQRHGLCLPDADSFTYGATYEYNCPVVGDRVQILAPEQWGQVAVVCPPGSVPIALVDPPL